MYSKDYDTANGAQLTRGWSRNKLGDLFFAMPNEIQVCILCLLEVKDVLSLRLASQSFFDLLSLNAFTISRSVLPSSSLGGDPLYLQTLYPQPSPNQNLAYFVQMLHRQAVVEKIVLTVADFIQFEIYQIKSASRQRIFAPTRRRLMENFRPSAFIIYHFLETLRGKIITGIRGHTPTGPYDLCHTCYDYQDDIIMNYPRERLLPAYQFYKILISAFRQKLRPPTYAGILERKLRGWDRQPPTERDMFQVLLMGGLLEVQRIMNFSKYVLRLGALAEYLDKIWDRSFPIDIRGVDQLLLRSNVKSTEPADDLTALGWSNHQWNLYDVWTVKVEQRLLAERVVESIQEMPDAFSYIEDIIDDFGIQTGTTEEVPVHDVDLANQVSDSEEGVSDVSETEAPLGVPVATSSSSPSHLAAPPRATFAPIMNAIGW